MRLIVLVAMLFFNNTWAIAARLPATMLVMSCFVISPDDKWSYRDYGFSVSYKNRQGKLQTLSARSLGDKKNCTQESVSVIAPMPAGKISFHLNDFVGEAGSTIECTNTIKVALTKKQLGKVCDFMVKTPKYGDYTSTDECSLTLNCR